MKRALSVVTVILAAGCTLDSPGGPPALSGPSGLGLVVNVSATPTVLPQDGASQATIEVRAADADGQPLAGRSFFIEAPFDFKVLITSPATSCPFGTFSGGPDEDNAALLLCRGFMPVGSATITTGSDGRASAVLSAPAALNAAGDVVATVTVTPLGGSFGDSSYARTVHLKLMAF